MAFSAEIERVMDQGNCLMPDINICQSDLANPTEPFVTKIMVHYLRCYGFRLEPPYKIGSELGHSSREARVFLIRVCRQVERIVQISFPNKTYSYVDIIKPTVKKTLATLSYLFNHLAYYKMFKKKVLGPVEEAIKLKESLTTEVKAKSQQLDQCSQKSKDCEVTINQLKKDLQDTQAKLLPLKKSCSEHENTLELLTQQQTEQDKRIGHWKQLVVEDSQVTELREKIKSASSHVESCKAELASKKQETNEHRRIIENSQHIATALEKATTMISLCKLDDYKESCKQLETVEKQLPTCKVNYQKRLQDAEAKKQELALRDQRYEERNQENDAENHKLHSELNQLQVDVEDRKKRLEDLSNTLIELDQQNLGQDQLYDILSEQIHEALGQNWQMNST
ncbi:kinetochore protein NUF2 homolog [Drosophila santomea]|uniref:kinetochore protein NUF2 homolog n=1 Tax=Drosophila santomea TaxID=129105 RepID=UPI001952CE3D|nr:kinetochore protein NUF2 homolog [Drosophila santomea]